MRQNKNVTDAINRADRSLDFIRTAIADHRAAVEKLEQANEYHTTEAADHLSAAATARHHRDRFHERANKLDAFFGD